MKKLILISALLFSFNGWAEYHLSDKPHLFSLKCEGIEIPWSFFGINKNYYIDVYADIDITNETWKQEYTDSDLYIFHQTNFGELAGRAYSYRMSFRGLTKVNPSDISFEWDYHSKNPRKLTDERITGHQWELGHRPGDPHSINIDRLTLEATWKFDENDSSFIIYRNMPQSLEDPFGELIEYKSQCEIAEKGEPQRWQKEINKPFDDGMEEYQKEIYEKRKL
jgi:hypothetical protein